MSTGKAGTGKNAWNVQNVRWKRRLMAWFLVLSLALGGIALPVAAAEGQGAFSNFQKTGQYYDGLFPDVAAGDWFREYVAAAYELGLLRGDNSGFHPAGNLRLSETLALAARLHSIYHTGQAEFQQGEPWYWVYADYAMQNGLLPQDRSWDYDAWVTRSQFAAILARALPEEALPAVNDIPDGGIPDVRSYAANAPEIYRLYRAGILTGDNSRGRFTPDASIQRSAAAAILTRMAYRSLRQKFTLSPPVWPDLQQQTPLEDSAFSATAFLGNSLVQGLSLYAGLDTASFFCNQGVTVYTVEQYVDALCAGVYDRVYIELGINELFAATDSVISVYGEIIDRIRSAMPETEVYVMAVTPVTKARSDEGNFTMGKIIAFNAALRTMCLEKNCWYLDCCGALADESGYLPEAFAGWDASPHLSTSGYQAWADVIRTYYDAYE